MDPHEPVITHQRVALVAPLPPLDKLYSYSVPTEIASTLRAGQRVEVPIGRRGRIAPGFCVGFSDQPWTSTLKPLLKILDKESLLDESLIELGLWISRYYCCPPGRSLAALVPEAVRRQSGFRRVRRVALAKSLAEIEASGERTGPRMRRLLEYLASRNEPAEIARLKAELQCGEGSIKTALGHGWVTVETVKLAVDAPDFDQPVEEPAFTLNDDQQHAVASACHVVDSGQFRVLLLFGVPGSGKTEVYIRAIHHVVARGRQAILLVPEIALTTQLVGRLARRFTDVAVIHSGLTDSQRSLLWADIASGGKRVIIGTRSAIFAPARQLGLIIVDEEQDGSYKNLQSPRFHSRDVAIVRARQASIPVLLGSATPSLETWHNAGRLPHYEIVRLPRRVSNLPMPQVHVIAAQGGSPGRTGRVVFSPEMESQIRHTLDQHRQAVLLLNRRGYSSTIFCPRCGWTAVCPNCSASLVFHKAAGVARCHRCSTRQPMPSVCPNNSCGGSPLRFGMGTERVEEELRRKFPHARVARADSDTMLRNEDYEQLIRRFEAAEYDILIGTQMIAKGLDFPLVSFVGVLNADVSLNIPDFRAGERTFQLVMQVAGRAGRAEGQGLVYVQTGAPEMAAIRLAVRQDFEAFASEEIEVRRQLQLPPLWRMARIVLADPRDSHLKQEAERLAHEIRQTATGISSFRCDGPTRCAIERERKLHRYELLLRDQTAEGLGRVLDQVRGKVFQSIRVKQLMVDVDPTSLL